MRLGGNEGLLMLFWENLVELVEDAVSDCNLFSRVGGWKEDVWGFFLFSSTSPSEYFGWVEDDPSCKPK